jgi:hypothetical protein
MNERIKSLLAKAHLDVMEDLGDIDSNHVAEKFAKLIVKECTKVVENLSPGYDDYRNQIEDAFRRDCVEQMKQHFGVEE